MSDECKGCKKLNEALERLGDAYIQQANRWLLLRRFIEEHKIKDESLNTIVSELVQL